MALEGRPGLPKLPERLLFTASMVLNLRDRRKWDLDDSTIRAFYFDTWSSQSLRGFHALHNAADAPAVEGYDFNIVLAVKRLKCRKCFGDFHSCPIPPEPIESDTDELIKYLRGFCAQAVWMSIRENALESGGLLFGCFSRTLALIRIRLSLDIQCLLCWRSCMQP